jgi:hypothetical protein
MPSAYQSLIRLKEISHACLLTSPVFAQQAWYPLFPRVAQRDALSTEMTSIAGSLCLLVADEESEEPLACEKRGAVKGARQPLRLKYASRYASRGNCSTRFPIT